MDIETKTSEIKKILSDIPLIDERVINEKTEAIIALDSITPEQVEAIKLEEKAREIAELEAKVAQANAIIAEVNPRLAELKGVSIEEIKKPIESLAIE